MDINRDTVLLVEKHLRPLVIIGLVFFVYVQHQESLKLTQKIYDIEDARITEAKESKDEYKDSYFRTLEALKNNDKSHNDDTISYPRGNR